AGVHSWGDAQRVERALRPPAPGRRCGSSRRGRSVGSVTRAALSRPRGSTRHPRRDRTTEASRASRTPHAFLRRVANGRGGAARWYCARARTAGEIAGLETFPRGVQSADADWAKRLLIQRSTKTHFKMMHSRIETDEIVERYVRQQLSPEEQQEFEEH